MNGPGSHPVHDGKSKGMYKVKKAFQIPDDIPLAKCMYRVNPLPSEIGSQLHNSTGLTNGEGDVKRSPGKSLNTTTSTDTSKSNMGKSKSNPPVSAVAKPVENVETDPVVQSLEKRQLQIIEKLERLRDMITTIHGKCVSPSEISSTTIRPDFSDIVVRADPRSPPYSLLFFRKLLAQHCGYNVTVTPHIHSSCTETLPSRLKVFDSSSVVNALFNITLIWKPLDGDCELIVSPINQVPIKGEANLCRFLSRYLPSAYSLNYDSLDLNNLVRVENILSTILQQTFNLDQLEQTLKSAKPFVIGELSLADLVCFSEAATLLTASNSQINKYPNINQWVNTCQTLGGFRVLAV